MSNEFTIAETGVDGVTVTLKERDMPFGGPRHQAAFDLGGPVEAQEIWLEGRSTPIIHVSQSRNEPLVLKGHFRDHLWAEPEHARDMMDALEKIRRRARVVTLSYDNLRWEAFLKRAKFGFESISDITYELEFQVILAPGAANPRPPAEPTTAAPDMILAQMKAILTKRRADALASFLLVALRMELDGLFDGTLKAMELLAKAAEDFIATPRKREREIRRMVARSEEFKAKARALKNRLSTVVAEQSVVEKKAAAVAQTQALKYETIVALSEAEDLARYFQYLARKAQNARAELYRVKEGDTLEKIAAARLGSSSRAPEIGLRPSDIRPGRLIRIPSPEKE